jgi:hypothetical protein
MNPEEISYKPVKGQTFELFGGSETAAGYYRCISSLTDALVAKYNGQDELLDIIRNLSRNKNRLKKYFHSDKTNHSGEYILKFIYPELHPYTEQATNYTANLSVLKKFDRTLNTSEFQYHLQMLEVELVNRIHISAFKKAEKKIALLPHCLRDLSKNCKSAMGDLDYVCKKCSKDCFIRHASEVLTKYDVDPYIWMTMDLKKLARRLMKEGQNFGVMGIACFPELVNGMRMCMKNSIPVVGIPLNANRCVRWAGSFFENSVHLQALDDLLR